MTKDEILSAASWCHGHAAGIMSIAAGAATTSGDPEGALEMIHSMASDIAINLQMLADDIASQDTP
jgi:hypothetical protein